MRVFLLAPGENWIVDRFVEEFFSENLDIVTSNPYDADVVWLIADWAYDQLPYDLLMKKRVITSVHHIVPEKFDSAAKAAFVKRDNITNVYHVPCNHTQKQVLEILESIGSQKPVMVRPFWVNDRLWQPTSDLSRLALGLDLDAFYVASFQRDTEGFDLKSPKLEKGPDILADVFETLQDNGRSPQALLAGWRRQYILNRLNERNIKTLYKQLPDNETIRHLYQSASVYVVSSRYEGGPQAIVEAAAMVVPIVSTDVGVAPEILHPSSIFTPGDTQSILSAIDFSRTSEARKYAYDKVKEHFLENSFPWFRDLIKGCV